MAKIFDKIVSRFVETRLRKTRQSREWKNTEIEELPAMQQRKNNALLAKKQNSLNKALEKSAFNACDKTDYIEDALAKKQRKYDVRQFMSYRVAYHSAAKAIFAAVGTGASYDEALAKLKQKTDNLKQKREAYVAKLDAQKQTFLQNNGTSDSAEYDKLRAEYEKQYDEYAATLAQNSEKYIAERKAKLQAKAHKCELKEKAYKEKLTSHVELPQDVLLRVENLKMYFGGLKAVDDLTFDVKEGEIFGLIGPNGAGKTTVFNCITRFYNATGGNMYFRNKDNEAIDLRRFKVHDVILEGLSRTFQNVELVKEISVLENLLVACTRNYRSNFFVQALGIPTVKKEDNILKSKAMRVLKFMGIESYAAWPAMGLPYGILKKVEIARALMADPKLIVLDEPAAGLNNTETTQLAKLIVRIRDEFGCSVLLVEHDMSLVMSICDRICAISFGKMLALGTPAEIQANKQVQEAYLGVDEDAEKAEQNEEATLTEEPADQVSKEQIEDATEPKQAKEEPAAEQAAAVQEEAQAEVATEPEQREQAVKAKPATAKKTTTPKTSSTAKKTTTPKTSSATKKTTTAKASSATKKTTAVKNTQASKKGKEEA